MRYIGILLFILIFVGCEKDSPPMEEDTTYTVSGSVINNAGIGQGNIQVYYNATEFVTTSANGAWTISGLSNTNSIRPRDDDFTFDPIEVSVSSARNNLEFTATEIIETYTASGSVVDVSGSGIGDIKVYYNSTDFVTTDATGGWSISNLSNSNTIRPTDADYIFDPIEVIVNEAQSNIVFTGELKAYDVSGSINNVQEGIKVFYNATDFVTTDANGNWAISELRGTNIIRPSDDGYVFDPLEISVDTAQSDLVFNSTTIEVFQRNENARKVTNWFNQQQRVNGLLESAENSNFVSLYDNALAAMLFMLNDDFDRAEKIFDFFNSRIESELKAGPGGFHWFRTGAGAPYDNRWIGDNAWMLIALNNYKSMTGDARYDGLADEIALWIRSLQNTDGGVSSGFAENGDALPFVITEGVVDAFNAVPGYDDFHEDILGFLAETRWDSSDKALVAWPSNPNYKYSVDNQSWGYLMFEDYPESVLALATDRLLNTQTATINNESVTGYDIDEDRDAIFVEGTGQMAVAYGFAGNNNERDRFLLELEKMFVTSTKYTDAIGLPYTANLNGTFIEQQTYWTGADTEIALSTGAWYVFAVKGFNPLAVQRNKGIPSASKFWVK